MLIIVILHKVPVFLPLFVLLLLPSLFVEPLGFTGCRVSVLGHRVFKVEFQGSTRSGLQGLGFRSGFRL